MTTATPDLEARKYQRIGRYELLGEIASGGMATVFLGRAIGVKGFARLVAIKKLHPHLEREEDFVAAFLDEARLAARIRHPNVVPTLDVDDQDGLYIVLEYVEGDRLLGLLRHAAKSGQPIPVPIALKIAVETLSGLHAAHELMDDDRKPLNLVHRDVSPQNVLIGIDGVTKITDFGIAKAESRLVTTRDGQLKGKIAYMPPEQARGGAIDRRVDVFAMGILLWEMLTSRRLFKGDNDVEILTNVLSLAIPTVRSIVPTIPAELDAAVMKALERDPEQRQDSALALAVALEDMAHLVGGLAPTRVVAQYVERIAGPKLEAERERIRSGVQIVGLKETPSLPSAQSGVGVRPKLLAEAAIVSKAAVEATRLDESGAVLDEDPAVPTRSRRLVYALGAAGIAALVVTVGLMISRHGGSSTASPTASLASVERPAVPAAAVTTPVTPPAAPPVAAAAPPATSPVAAVVPPPAAPPVVVEPVANPTTVATAGTPIARPHGATTTTQNRPGTASGTHRPATQGRPHGTGPSDEDIDSIAINPYRH